LNRIEEHSSSGDYSIHVGINYGNITQINQNAGIAEEKIPYAFLPKKNKQEFIQQFAYLTHTILETGNEIIPFVTPLQFRSLIENKDDKNDVKLLIMGPEGAGKSRLIYEIFNSRINSYDDVFILNPSGRLEGIESGDISVTEIVTKRVTPSSLIVWVDFPDPMMSGESIEGALATLQQISSSRVKSILIKVKSNYANLFADVERNLINLKPIQIEYSLEDMKEIIKEYGIKILEFQQAYQSVVSQSIDTLAGIFLNKSPIPATVKLFYEQLLADKSLYPDPIDIAYKLPSVSDFYSSLLESLSREQPPVLDFLFSLKLCYDLKIKRTVGKLVSLQRNIFATEAPGNIHLLKRWVEFRSNEFSFSYNSIRNIIDYGMNINKIMAYISSQPFLEATPKENSSDFSLGFFYGKNFENVDMGESPMFLTTRNHFKERIGFKDGLASGLSRLFYDLDVPEQLKVLNLLNQEFTLAVLFFTYFRLNFRRVTQPTIQRLWSEISKNTQISALIGIKFGLNFSDLDDETVEKIFTEGNQIKQFFFGFSMGMARIFPKLDKNNQIKIWNKLKSDRASTLTFGIGIGLSIPFFRGDLKQVLNLIDKTIRDADWFHIGMILGGVSNLAFQEQEDREYLLDGLEELIRKDAIENKLGILMLPYLKYLASNYFKVDEDMKQRILKIGSNSVIHGIGIGAGIVTSNALLEENQRRTVFDLISIGQTNGAVAEGVLVGLGNHYYSYDEETRNQLVNYVRSYKLMEPFLGGVAEMSFMRNSIDPLVLEEIKADNNLALMIGGSLINLMFNSYGAELKEQISQIAAGNKSFAKGIAMNLTALVPLMTDTDKIAVKEFIQRSKNIKKEFKDS
jgi:hypothetical protein